MHKPNLICTILVSLSLVLVATMPGCSRTGPPDTEKHGDEEAPLLSRVPLRYDKLSSFLDEEETAALDAVHQKYRDTLEKWNAENGEAVGDARAALFDFVKTKDKTAAKKAMQDAKRNNVQDLIREEQAIQKEYEAAVIDVVPVEKLKLWQADKISRTLLEFLEPLQLTEEQEQQVYELAPTALQRISAKDRDVWHARGTVNLESLVGQQVLTAAQKQPFEELKAKHRLRKMKWAW